MLECDPPHDYRCTAMMHGCLRTGLRLLAFIVLVLYGPPVLPQSDIVITKSVVPEAASSGETVEFTVSVRNDRTETAIEMLVTDSLPAGLSIPAGMAAFVSQGSYDPDSGAWSLGDLDAGGEAVLTLPAQIEAMPPPCLVNEATIEAHADDDEREASARGAVRAAGVERCVDLEIANALFRVPQPFCSDDTVADFDFLLINRGPDVARDVVVSVQQSPANLPGFRFISTGCGGTSPLRCELGDVAPGVFRLLNVQSAPFNNRNAYSLSLVVNAVTSDEDYAAGNNRRTSQHQVPVTVAPPCDIPVPFIGGASGCFIATAAWGSAWHDEVLTLRRFRDRTLLHSPPGRAFVRAYYRLSPPIADYIADKPIARTAVRAVLTPVVLAVRYPLIACFPLPVFIVLVVVVRRSHRGRSAAPA